MYKTLNFANGYIVGGVLIGALSGLAYGGQVGPGRAAPSSEAVSDRPSSLEGNWFVEWHDYPEKGKVTRVAGNLARQWEQKCVQVEGGGCRYQNVLKHAKNYWPLYYTGDVVGSAHFEVEASGLVTVNHHRLASKLQQTSPDEIRGTWRYGDKGGNEIWRRALARVSHAVFKSLTKYNTETGVKSKTTLGGAPGRVETNYSGPDKYNMPEGRPRFSVEVYGENLWGNKHLIDFGDAAGLQAPRGLWWTYIMKDGGRRNSDVTILDVREVLGIEQTVVIWEHATPGLKTLHVDGIAIPFELVIKGYPGETVKAPGTAAKAAEIKFVRKTDKGFEAIPEKTLRYGDRFVVEVKMDSDTKPEDKQRSVKLDWGKGPDKEKKIEVYRKSARIFGSEIFRLEPAPPETKTPPTKASPPAVSP